MNFLNLRSDMLYNPRSFMTQDNRIRRTYQPVFEGNVCMANASSHKTDIHLIWPEVIEDHVFPDKRPLTSSNNSSTGLQSHGHLL
jgi:hypothetical protein